MINTNITFIDCFFFLPRVLLLGRFAAALSELSSHLQQCMIGPSERQETVRYIYTVYFVQGPLGLLLISIGCKIDNQTCFMRMRILPPLNTKAQWSPTKILIKIRTSSLDSAILR